tara:strand:+ start:71 stop:247 length:177 start_codon:yes stop_codon:yes gene_type:complete
VVVAQEWDPKHQDQTEGNPIPIVQGKVVPVVVAVEQLVKQVTVMVTGLLSQVAINGIQ